MPSRSTDSDRAQGCIVWINPEGGQEELASALEKATAQQGLSLIMLQTAHLSEEVLSKVCKDLPMAVAYSDEPRHLPRAVRLIRAVFPIAQLLLFGENDQRSAYVDQLRTTPSAGTYWSYLGSIDGELGKALRDAVRSTRQRMQFRNTISRINSRIEKNQDKRLERLVISDRVLASVLKASNDAIFLLDTRMRIGEWNPSCERTFGIKARAANGRLAHELFDGPDGQVFLACVNTVLRTGRSLIRELVLQAGEGPQAEVEISFNLVPALQGSADELVAIQARDVSQRRAIDRALMAAKEAAETANRTKSEFLANMSHEIRTPMTSILGFAEILEERMADPEDLEFVQTIKQNGAFLLEIINDILDLSKIEAGRMEISAVQFDPCEVARAVGDMMRVRANSKNQQFDLRCTDTTPSSIVGDPLRVRQVLINLVGNAIKFTPSGGRVELGVTARKKLISYQVKDTGPGIAPEHRDAIFAPFNQGDKRVSERHGGTGLGLTISRRLANLMGGSLEVESEPGSGSTFRLLLPYQLPPDVLSTEEIEGRTG